MPSSRKRSQTGGRSKPSNGLERIIEILRWIPPGYTFPDLQIDMAAFSGLKQNDVGKAKRIFTRAILRSWEAAERPPKALLQWLNTVTQHSFEGVDYQWFEYSPLERYRAAKVWRESLRAIAKAGRDFRAYAGTSESFSDNDLESVFTHISLGTPAAVFVNGAGNLQISSDEFLEALKGASATRIRECPICLHLYWAYRKDSGHCGESDCKTRLSSKNYYDNPEKKQLAKRYYEARKKKLLKAKRTKEKM